MERHISLILCCLFAAFSFANCFAPLEQDPNPDLENVDKPDYRLNNDIEPISYTINVRPYFHHTDASKAFTFDAASEIEFKATRDNLKSITLHIKELAITQQVFDKNENYVTGGTYDNVTDKYTLSLKNALRKGKAYRLKFTYTGKLQTDMHGFYSSKYTENNTTK